MTRITIKQIGDGELYEVTDSFGRQSIKLFAGEMLQIFEYCLLHADELTDQEKARIIRAQQRAIERGL